MDRISPAADPLAVGDLLADWDMLLAGEITVEDLGPEDRKRYERLFGG